MSDARDIEDNTQAATTPAPHRQCRELPASVRQTAIIAYGTSDPVQIVRDLVRARRHYCRAVPQRTARGRPCADER